MILVPDLLETVLATTRKVVEVRSAQTPIAVLNRAAGVRTPRRRDFEAALGRSGSWNVIAECKRRSPSRGVLRDDYHAAGLARQYEAAGACAISVLTEPTFFDGSLDDLRAARDAVNVPVLRKDFIVDDYQLLEARAAGADAVLLIVGALDDGQMRKLLAGAAGLDLAALVEVHEETELARALEAGATLVGVNSRNLRTLDVEPQRLHDLIQHVPPGVVAVAESGLRTREEVHALASAGYRAFLIGESLVTQPNPGEALNRLLAHSPNEE